MAKHTIYLSDDLEQRIRDARANGGVNVSGASQLAIGFAINHGDRALSDALHGTGRGDGHQDQDQAEPVPPAGRLGNADQLGNEAHQGASTRLASIEQQIRLMALAFLALLTVSAMTLVSVRALRTA